MTGRRERGEGRRALFARALAFSLVILFVFQGLVTVVSISGAGRPSHKNTILTALLSARCGVDTGHETPTPGKDIVKTQCCALCGQRTLDVPIASGLIAEGKALSRRAPQHSFGRYVAHSLARPPTGWASSWSSQAPPSAS